MGGSGGGYNPPGGGPSLNCETIDFATTLLSTDAAVLSKIKKGDVLRVRGGDYSAIVVTDSEERVGSIVTNAVQLLACMASGHAYVAQVLEVADGACRVRIAYENK